MVSAAADGRRLLGSGASLTSTVSSPTITGRHMLQLQCRSCKRQRWTIVVFLRHESVTCGDVFAHHLHCKIFCNITCVAIFFPQHHLCCKKKTKQQKIMWHYLCYKSLSAASPMLQKSEAQKYFCNMTYVTNVFCNTTSVTNIFTIVSVLQIFPQHHLWSLLQKIFL